MWSRCERGERGSWRTPGAGDRATLRCPQISSCIQATINGYYAILMFCVLLGLLFKLNITMACVLVAFLPANMALAWYEGHLVGVAASTHRDNERDFASYAEEMLSLNVVKRALGVEAALEKGLADRAQATLSSASETDQRNSLMVMHLLYVDVVYKARGLVLGI